MSHPLRAHWRPLSAPACIAVAMVVTVLSLAGVRDAMAQSVVRWGPAYTITVDGEVVLPFGGWGGLGEKQPQQHLTGRRVIERDLDSMALRVSETPVRPVLWTDPGYDTRLIAMRVDRSWYNAVGQYRPGGSHVRPGAFVEAWRWLLREAHRREAYAVVPLQSFVKPLPRDTTRDHVPYHGYSLLTCEAYSTLVADETRVLERYARTRRPYAFDPGRIPPVACGDPDVPSLLPYWEWNLWYVVRSLRDEPGLLGWFLWDEPVDGVNYPLFGGRYRGAAPRAWTPMPGTSQPPTPNLLHYAYARIAEFEETGRTSSYVRHPVVVETGQPHWFTRQFSWSERDDREQETRRQAARDNLNGPFDVLPDGRVQFPADILAGEASGQLVHTGPSPDGRVDPRGWYRDANGISRARSSMVMDIVRRHHIGRGGTDNLWAGMQLAQAQLPDRASLKDEGRYPATGFGRYGPLRDWPNDQTRTRLLNDRDLVWQALTPLVDGIRGLAYYGLRFTPRDREAPGAEVVQRINRLSQQFAASALPHALIDPPLSAAEHVQRIEVQELTNYYRSDFDFVGSFGGREIGASQFAEQCRPCIEALDSYTWGEYGREETAGRDATGYGHSIKERGAWRIHTDYTLLRVARHRHEGFDYLFVSHAYDARIRVDMALPRGADSALSTDVEEARFDLDPQGRFAWIAPSRLAVDRSTPTNLALSFEMGPYEARVFRIRLRVD